MLGLSHRPEIKLLLFLPGLCLHCSLCWECPSSVTLLTGRCHVDPQSVYFSEHTRHLVPYTGNCQGAYTVCPVPSTCMVYSSRTYSRSETLLCTWLWSGDIRDSRTCLSVYFEKQGWLCDSSKVLPKPLEWGEMSSWRLLEVI